MCEKELSVCLPGVQPDPAADGRGGAAGQGVAAPVEFEHSLQIWIAWSQRQFLSDTKEDTATLFLLIAQIRVGKRPGRVEPRAVKRRPKPYPRLNKPREKARQDIRKQGHARSLSLIKAGIRRNFGAYVKNLNNGISVTIRINDRAPCVKGRI